MLPLLQADVAYTPLSSLDTAQQSIDADDVAMCFDTRRTVTAESDFLKIFQRSTFIIPCWLRFLGPDNGPDRPPFPPPYSQA